MYPGWLWNKLHFNTIISRFGFIFTLYVSHAFASIELTIWSARDFLLCSWNKLGTCIQINMYLVCTNECWMVWYFILFPFLLLMPYHFCYANRVLRRMTLMCVYLFVFISDWVNCTACLIFNIQFSIDCYVELHWTVPGCVTGLCWVFQQK